MSLLDTPNDMKWGRRRWWGVGWKVCVIVRFGLWDHINITLFTPFRVSDTWVGSHWACRVSSPSKESLGGGHRWKFYVLCRLLWERFQNIRQSDFMCNRPLTWGCLWVWGWNRREGGILFVFLSNHKLLKSNLFFSTRTINGFKFQGDLESVVHVRVSHVEQITSLL